MSCLAWPTTLLGLAAESPFVRRACSRSAAVGVRKLFVRQNIRRDVALSASGQNLNYLRRSLCVLGSCEPALDGMRLLTGAVGQNARPEAVRQLDRRVLRHKLRRS